MGLKENYESCLQPPSTQEQLVEIFRERELEYLEDTESEITYTPDTIDVAPEDAEDFFDFWADEASEQAVYEYYSELSEFFEELMDETHAQEEDIVLGEEIYEEWLKSGS